MENKKQNLNLNKSHVSLNDENLHSIILTKAYLQKDEKLTKEENEIFSKYRGKMDYFKPVEKNFGTNPFENIPKLG